MQYVKQVLLCTILAIFSFFQCNAVDAIPSAQTPKKKIVVLVSKGGNGHMAACNVLKESLPEYEIVVANPFEDIVDSFDFVKKITVGKLDGEEFYVSFVQHDLVRTASFLARYPAILFFHLKRHYFVKKFVNYLNKQKPDLLISTIPYYNYAASTAAQRCNIPFLIVTLDADLQLWLPDFEKCRNNNYAITLNKQTPRITKQLARSKVAQDKIHVVGAPLRKEFFEQKDREKILSEWKIPHDKSIIMLIRGGTGSMQLIRYVQTLLKNKMPLHLLVCIGKNTKIIPRLKRLKETHAVTYSIIPFTKKIADLMAVSDLVITQPSPNVCNEAMQSNLPILVDLTGPCLFWELATIDWIQQKNAGAIFKRMSNLNKLVSDCLRGKRKFAKTRELTPMFNTTIHSIVQAMLTKNRSVKVT